MYGSRAFTLLEVLIAITILGVTFTTVYSLLYKAKSDFGYAQKMFDSFLYIDGAIKENKTSDLKKTERDLQGYPIREIIYEKDGISIKIYQPKQ